jgi:hypothetical protein
LPSAKPVLLDRLFSQGPGINDHEDGNLHLRL